MVRTIRIAHRHVRARWRSTGIPRRHIGAIAIIQLRTPIALLHDIVNIGYLAGKYVGRMLDAGPRARLSQPGILILHKPNVGAFECSAAAGKVPDPIYLGGLVHIAKEHARPRSLVEFPVPLLLGNVAVDHASKAPQVVEWGSRPIKCFKGVLKVRKARRWRAAVEVDRGLDRLRPEARGEPRIQQETSSLRVQRLNHALRYPILMLGVGRGRFERNTAGHQQAEEGCIRVFPGTVIASEPSYAISLGLNPGFVGPELLNDLLR